MKRGLISFLFILLIVTPLLVSADPDITIPSIRNRTNSALEKDMELSESLKDFTRFMFKIKKDSNIDYKTLIVLICTSIIFFFIIQDVLTFVPFFDTQLKSIIFAIIVTLLSGISGGFLAFAGFMLDIGSLFGALQEWSILSLVISLFLIIAGFVILAKITGGVRERLEIEIEEAEGEDIGKNISLLKSLVNSFRK